MSVLKLKPNPTFRAKVSIQVAGDEPATLLVTFKHRTRDQLDAWLKESQGRDDVSSILEIAEGWDLLEPFDADNVRFLVQNYIGAPVALVESYIAELTKAKAKN